MTDAELTELDLAVARVLGLPVWYSETGEFFVGSVTESKRFQPTRDWADCGPLAERFDYAHFTNEQADGWVLEADGLTVHADTPQIAICRAIVASGG